MRILIVSPSIEDTTGRGLNKITENIIDGLASHGHEVGLLIGLPKRKHLKEDPAYDHQIDQIYLQHYLAEGRKSFKYVVRGGYRKINVAKAIIKGSIYKSRYVTVDKELLKNKRSLLNKLNFCIESPYIYQFISRNHHRRSSKALKKICKDYGVDLIIATSPIAITKHDLPNSTKLVQFVHDFMPIELTETPPDHDTPITFAKQAYSAVQGSHLLLTNSVDTQNKILERNPQANTMVLYGMVRKPDPGVKSGILKQKNLKPGSYLVFASALEKRKNLENLLDAYTLAFETIHKMPLVLIGAPGYGFKDILEKHDSLPEEVRDSVLFTGYISNDERDVLYMNARACVFPSIYEGLGIPVVEAIAAGIPVLTTNIGALPEAGMKAALYINNPYDIAEITDGINRVVNDDKLRESLKSNQQEVVAFFGKENYDQRISEAVNIMENLVND